MNFKVFAYIYFIRQFFISLNILIISKMFNDILREQVSHSIATVLRLRTIYEGKNVFALFLIIISLNSIFVISYTLYDSSSSSKNFTLEDARMLHQFKRICRF